MRKTLLIVTLAPRLLPFFKDCANTNFRILSKLLKKLGYTLASRKEGRRGQQVRIWYIANLDDGDRTDILKALDQKYVIVESSDKHQPDTVSTMSSIDLSLQAVDTTSSNKPNTRATLPPS